MTTTNNKRSPKTMFHSPIPPIFKITPNQKCTREAKRPTAYTMILDETGCNINRIFPTEYNYNHHQRDHPYSKTMLLHFWSWFVPKIKYKCKCVFAVDALSEQNGLTFCSCTLAAFVHVFFSHLQSLSLRQQAHTKKIYLCSKCFLHSPCPNPVCVIYLLLILSHTQRLYLLGDLANIVIIRHRTNTAFIVKISYYLNPNRRGRE